MAEHVVVQVVTQPFHGPDGNSVLYSPGDQFPEGEELPEGVRTTLAVAEVPEPEPKAAEAPAEKAAGKPAPGKG